MSWRTAPQARRVVVIGGGFCGAALAVHLLATGWPGWRIALVERAERCGRGLAYGTADPLHLLDEPAGRMSLDPDDADAFARYARSRRIPADAGSLLPRSLYGDYVEDALERAARVGPGVLRRVRGEAVAVRRAADGREVVLADGGVLPADDVVLALGHGPPRVPEALRPIASHPRVHHRPLDLPAFDPEDRVLIVGTGPTAIDVLLGLRARRHEGRVLALSRSGIWPYPHGAACDRAVDLALPREPTAEGLVEWIRGSLARADGERVPWQAMADAVRARMPAAWAALPAYEQGRFLAARGRWWDRLCHRAPVEALAALAQLREDLVLVDRAAEIVHARAFDTALVVRLRLTGEDVAFRAGHEESWTFERVVLCTGAATTPAGPLAHDLLARGEVRADPHRGLATDPLGRAIGADGAARHDLWVLGPTLHATTVPELARQARDRAGALGEAWTVQGRVPAAVG